MNRVRTLNASSVTQQIAMNFNLLSGFGNNFSNRFNNLSD